jgi:hypothetical protein
MLVIRFLFRHIFASARLCGSHRLILHDFIHAGQEGSTLVSSALSFHVFACIYRLSLGACIRRGMLAAHVRRMMQRTEHLTSLVHRLQCGCLVSALPGAISQAEFRGAAVVAQIFLRSGSIRRAEGT